MSPRPWLERMGDRTPSSRWGLRSVAALRLSEMRVAAGLPGLRAPREGTRPTMVRGFRGGRVKALGLEYAGSETGAPVGGRWLVSAA